MVRIHGGGIKGISRKDLARKNIWRRAHGLDVRGVDLLMGSLLVLGMVQLMLSRTEKVEGSESVRKPRLYNL